MHTRSNYFSLITVLFLLLFCSQNLFSQQLNKNQQYSKTDNFYEIQKRFNEKWDSYNVKNGYYIENGEKKKAPNWKIFKREEYYWEQRVNLQTGEFPQTNAAAEYEKVEKSLKKSNSFSESWNNLGTNSSDGGYAGIGRINCVAFHPSDANTFWVGSPSGGIWKTSNGGTNWAIQNSSMTTLGVSDIAIPSDFDGATVNTIYIATGDRDGGSMHSLSGGQGADNVTVGVYKSTDGGASWSATNLVYAKSTGARIYRLLIHPTNNSILIASTSDGIYKTSNGGTNWTKTSIYSARFRDMEFKPGNPTIIYAGRVPGGSTLVYKSTDTGDSWTSKTISGVVSHYSSQIELAVSANDPSIVYVLLQDGKIYKSTDSGESYAKVSTNDSQNMMGYYSDGAGTASQASYDLCMAVSPANANILLIGGVNTWKSNDGGVSWTINNMWTSSSTYNKTTPKAPVVHADKHILAYRASGIIFEGNDGGIYLSTNDGANWTDLSDGLVISQIYRIGVSQTNPTQTLTGLQDNGSKLYNSTWSDVKGGDGMECIIDYSNSDYMYATYVNGQITKSINGFTNWITEVDISANIPGGQPEGAWVTPYLIDPNNSSTLFAGYEQVWKTENRGDTWSSVSQSLSSSEKLRSLAIAPSNSDVLYASDKTNMWKTTDGGATNWVTVTLPVLSNSITYISVHPTDANTLWFTVGGYTSGQKVYQSTDGGGTWSSISTGLPNLPVMSIVHYKKATDRNVLFVGTDLGVYVKDGTNDWASYNSGLPNVVVSELEIYYNSGGTDKLRAGTFGRGLWETDIDAALPVELTSFAVNSIKGDNVSLEWETSTEVNNYGFEIERKLVNSNGTNSWDNLGFVQGAGNSNSPRFYSFIDNKVSGGNNFSYRLKQLDINGQFEYSDVVEVNVIPDNFALEQNYPNPFNPTTKISYRLPYRSQVNLKIFDVLGKEILQLVNDVKEPGLYSEEFNASSLPSGVYYYSIKAGEFSQTKKMMLVK